MLPARYDDDDDDDDDDSYLLIIVRLHTVVYFQVFLSNNLHEIRWFQLLQIII